MPVAASPASEVRPPQPWWRFGLVWMVVGGPAVVVVAGLVTFYLAVSNPDPVLPTYGQSSSQTRSITHAPALQGRNHAATGELPSAAGQTPADAGPGPAGPAVTPEAGR